jgi:hypothetical protein
VDALLESHEGRLQRVESGVTSCNISLAETRVEIKSIAETVRDGFEALGAKMDVSHAQHGQLSEGLRDLVPRLEKLEESHASRKRQVALVRKSGIGLVLTLAGAFFAKAGEYLWMVLK